ncbi:hypothetical protein OSTOST_17026, partial [Ostertagia ostertagi]
YYSQVSLQLLDLCSTLHSLAPGILAHWAKSQPEVDASIPHIWCTVWRPLLQAIARLGCDCRRLRAFLPTNMANLGAAEWESCFGEVLFPLLGKLLDVFSAMDPIGMEDTRVRAMQIVAKTLLNHLSPQPEPKSLTSVASASRIGGSRVQIAPALPSPAEESLPFATTTPASQPAAAPDTSVADSAPLSTVPASADHAHLDHESATVPSAAKVPATAPVNIPELTEVIVHSGAVSPASASSPITGSLPLSTASQYSMVSTAADADVASDSTAQ